MTGLALPLAALALPAAGDVAFGLAALAALAAAIVAVTRRNAAHAVVALLGLFGALAFLFVLQAASFLAAMELFLYAGAILVLFLFALMLLRPSIEGLADEREPLRWATWGVGALLLLLPLAAGLLFVALGVRSGTPPAGFGSARAVAREQFRLPPTAAPVRQAPSPAVAAEGGRRTAPPALPPARCNPYLLPFELVSALLVVALVGGVVLAWRRRPEED